MSNLKKSWIAYAVVVLAAVAHFTASDAYWETVFLATEWIALAIQTFYVTRYWREALR